jgi:hypothetical protein
MLDTLRRALTARGITVTVVGDACYGERRTDVLNRTRISVNLLSFPWELPGLRFSMSMGCDALVVSEPQIAPAPYLPGVHFVPAPAPELPAVIAHYLEREDERAAIARSAEQFVTTELTLDRQLAQLLRTVVAGWRSPGQ